MLLILAIWIAKKCGFSGEELQRLQCLSLLTALNVGDIIELLNIAETGSRALLLPVKNRHVSG